MSMKPCPVLSSSTINTAAQANNTSGSAIAEDPFPFSIASVPMMPRAIRMAPATERTMVGCKKSITIATIPSNKRIPSTVASDRRLTSCSVGVSLIVTTAEPVRFNMTYRLTQVVRARIGYVVH